MSDELSTPAPADEELLREFRLEAENGELRRALGETQRQLRRARAKVDELVAATHAGAMAAMLVHGPVPPVPAPKLERRTKRRAEVALWHLTDWQGDKVTTSYDSQVMRHRVLRFCDKAAKITEIQRADHPVNEAVLLLGGDMVEGLFNYPTQAFEIDASIFGQYTTVSRLLIDVVRRALAIYEKVTVVAEWGNHGRIGSKRSVVPRSDNFDRMTYELARQQLLAGETRLVWEDCPDDIQRVEIGKYRALLIHGDEIGRNGFASPMTIVGHVAKWKSGSYPWTFQDCYVGHYHVDQEFPLPDGRGKVYFGGSTESDNRYARDTMASSATPSQRLHFIDPTVGRVTSRHQVHLS